MGQRRHSTSIPPPFPHSLHPSCLILISQMPSESTARQKQTPKEQWASAGKQKRERKWSHCRCTRPDHLLGQPNCTQQETEKGKVTVPLWSRLTKEQIAFFYLHPLQVRNPPESLVLTSCWVRAFVCNHIYTFLFLSPDLHPLLFHLDPLFYSSALVFVEALLSKLSVIIPNSLMPASYLYVCLKGQCTSESHHSGD